MKIMHRRLQEVRDESLLGRVFEIEAESERLLQPLGHPAPERFRVFAAGDLHSQTRIQERTYPTLEAWAAATTAQSESDELSAIEADRRDVFLWERDEFYYVDAFGDANPTWMARADAVVQERRTAAAAKLNELLADAGRPALEDGQLYVAPMPEGEEGGHAAAPEAPRARMPIMYRQIQEIKPGKWAEQLELERKTDEVEASAGHPVPNRYRAFAAGALDSQLRVHQRVYPSIGDWGRFFEEWTTHESMQALEVERRQFYTWEREEILYVDLPGERRIRWMDLLVEAHAAAAAGEGAELRSILRHL